MGYEKAGDRIWTAPRAEHHKDEVVAREQLASDVNELPSVALTTRFLALCRQYGSEQLAVRIVAARRSTGVPGLPSKNDWTAWNAEQMRTAVEHLRRKLGK